MFKIKFVAYYNTYFLFCKYVIFPNRQTQKNTSEKNSTFGDPISTKKTYEIYRKFYILEPLYILIQTYINIYIGTYIHKYIHTYINT